MWCKAVYRKSRTFSVGTNSYRQLYPLRARARRCERRAPRALGRGRPWRRAPATTLIVVLDSMSLIFGRLASMESWFPLM